MSTHVNAAPQAGLDRSRLGQIVLVLQGGGALGAYQAGVYQALDEAGNLIAVARGGEPRAFRYRPRGMMAALGHRKGVAEIFGVRISGLPAWLLWRGYYLAQVPTLLRKLRIHVEWTWGMFFAADITHIRFSRSAELQEVPPARPMRAGAAREA